MQDRHPSVVFFIASQRLRAREKDREREREQDWEFSVSDFVLS